MAKAAWCTVAPMEGKEDGTINISAAAHTGRVTRDTTVTVTAKNGTNPSANIAVTQAGAVVTTTIDETKPDATPDMQEVTINGTSNSSKLRWSLKGGLLGGEINLLSMVDVVVKVNDTPIAYDSAIADDPGAIEIYNFVATLDISALKWAVDALATFAIIDDLDVKKTCVFVRKASVSSVSVNKSSLSLDGSGTTQSVGVSSNDEWAVS